MTINSNGISIKAVELLIVMSCLMKDSECVFQAHYIWLITPHPAMKTCFKAGLLNTKWFG